MRLHPDGTFSGRTDDLLRTTIISGRFDRGRRTATGTIFLATLSTPSNPLSPATATFTVRRRRERLPRRVGPTG